MVQPAAQVPQPVDPMQPDSDADDPDRDAAHFHGDQPVVLPADDDDDDGFDVAAEDFAVPPPAPYAALAGESMVISSFGSSSFYLVFSSECGLLLVRFRICFVQSESCHYHIKV